MNAVRYVHELCYCLTVLQPSDLTVIMCGDLNFPSINWNGDNSMLLNDSSINQSTRLLNITATVAGYKTQTRISSTLK